MENLSHFLVPVPRKTRRVYLHSAEINRLKYTLTVVLCKIINIDLSNLKPLRVYYSFFPPKSITVSYFIGHHL